MGDNTDAYAPPDALEDMTADQAEARIAELRTDEGFRAQLDSNHPGHKLANERLENLYRVAAGEPLPEGAGANDARARLERYRATVDADRTHPIWNKNHPGHAAALEERSRMYHEAYPEDAGAAQEAVAQTPPQDYEPELQDLRVPGDTVDAFRDGRDAVASWISDLRLLSSEARAFVQAFNRGLARGGKPDVDSAGQQDKALRAVWRDQYDAKKESAARAIKRVDRDGTLSELLDTTGMGQDADLMRALADTADRNGW